MTNLTLDNFLAETGFRFRVSKTQAARIALTNLDDTIRSSLRGASVETAVGVLGDAVNAKGKPFNWVKEALNMVSTWTAKMELTREGAFQEFLIEGGLKRLKGRKEEVPNSVYLDPALTLENFTALSEATTGSKYRFRMSRGQQIRLKAGELTREQALAEVVAAKRTAVEATDIKIIKDNNPVTNEEIEAALAD